MFLCIEHSLSLDTSIILYIYIYNNNILYIYRNNIYRKISKKKRNYNIRDKNHNFNYLI